METEHPIHGPEELRLLKLLKEVQTILANALNSMGGRTLPTPEATYLSWSAVSVNHSAAGYLWLRESGRVHASKLLVRPALEATFAGIAVNENREFLFRKAYTEWLEDKKLYPDGADKERVAAQALDDLKHAFTRNCPGYPIKCEKISVRDTADIARLLQVYDSSYRLYCQYTHGAMRAVAGQLDEATDPADTGTVIWCVLKMLERLQQHSPAQVPDISEFKELLITKRT